MRMPMSGATFSADGMEIEADMAQNRQILNKIASRSIPGAREALDALNCLNYAVDVADWAKASQALDLLRLAAEKFREAANDRKRAAVATLSAVWPKICGEDGRVIAKPSVAEKSPLTDDGDL